MPIILLDLVTGNVVSDFGSESEAWTSLREMAEEDGLDSLADLSLMLMQNSHRRVIAMEETLVERVADAMRPVPLASESRR